MLYQKTMSDGTVVFQEATNEGHIHILQREGFTEFKPAKKPIKPAPPASDE